jgi:pyridoxal phosphate enzyme (YggS family)
MESQLLDIRSRIQSAGKRACRVAVPVHLIAAAKGQSAARIIELLRLGVSDIGENRVQEAMAKQPEVAASGLPARWHLIGPLQSNKAIDAARHFDVVHSLDRPKIANALSDACVTLEKTLTCFIQVNIGREEQKSGMSLEELPEFVRYVRALPRLELIGLMAVPPADEPPAPFFALLAELAKREGLSELSMGMSSDFETAIRLGATHVRIGTALFGPRS